LGNRYQTSYPIRMALLIFLKKRKNVNKMGKNYNHNLVNDLLYAVRMREELAYDTDITGKFWKAIRLEFALRNEIEKLMNGQVLD